ncbi:hypothetical protein [Kitasatospora sp. P5_F3]
MSAQAVVLPRVAGGDRAPVLVEEPAGIAAHPGHGLLAAADRVLGHDPDEVGERSQVGTGPGLRDF